MMRFMEPRTEEGTRKLVESEATYRCIVENSPDLISIEDLDSHTIFGNPAFFEKLGYSPDEAAEINIFSIIHPDDLPEAKKAHKKILSGQVIRNMAYRYRTKDSSWLHVLTSAEKLKLGNQEVIQYVARDITDIKQLEIDLKRSEDYHCELLDNVWSGVYMIKDNKITWCNDRLCEIFGYESNELQGVYVAKLFPGLKQFYEYEKELYFTLAEKGHHHSEIKGKRKNGEIFDLEICVSIIGQRSDTHNEALAIVRDVTEIKRTQEKLIQSERLAASEKLAASIAHEINNPLQGIMASVATVKNEISDKVMNQKGLEIIEIGLKRISYIVKQLLDLHRPDGLDKQWTNINRIIEEVLSLTHSQLTFHNITIKKRLSQSISDIYGSTQQLHQIFLNLILNAQDAMPAGGEIEITTDNEDGHVVIKIRDHGTGIHSKDLPHIFDPFYSTKKKMGTGLGLSVVHGAVEAHGGKIEVSSKPDRGTEFTIRIPMKPDTT